MTVLYVIYRVNPRMGPIHFVKKLMFCQMDFFLAGPHIQAIQISCQLCSIVDIKDSWAYQILQRAHKKNQMANKNLEICMYLNGIWAIGPF